MTKKKEGQKMLKKDIAFVQECIRRDIHSFYTWSKWISVRTQVLEMDKGECQMCKNKYKRYRQATTVHHINHVKHRPDLALEIWIHDPATHEDKRNLISLCHDCHEEAHNYRRPEQKEPLTEERWD